ncbi:MAG: hypothetical protein ILO42_07660 [Clostridia bacterium]|nr:hypothetical protein [Clostridia bacterium]
MIDRKSGFRFQAHRGDSAHFPENTLVSYRAAMSAGYHVIELDNKFSKDDVCVCLHDGTVNRTCRRADGSVIEEKTPSDALTLAELQALDAGLFKGEEFAGTRIPTLEEALDVILGESTLSVKLDNVFQSFNEKRFEIFCSVLKNAGRERRIGLTCKTLPYLVYLAERFPEAEMHFDGSLTPEALGFIKNNIKDRAVLWIPFENKATAWCRERKADAAFCAELHEYGEVGIWLLAEPEELRVAVRDFGADIIETTGTLRPDALALI